MAKKAKKSKRKPSAAFMKPMKISDDLAAIVGSKPLPRTQVTKKLWAYIKKNKLQDKKNRRNINADDKLKKVFKGKKVVNMFEMTKLVNKHLS
jgi:upstream activation factor subunit UAF30